MEVSLIYRSRRKSWSKKIDSYQKYYGLQTIFLGEIVEILSPRKQPRLPWAECGRCTVGISAAAPGQAGWPHSEPMEVGRGGTSVPSSGVPHVSLGRQLRAEDSPTLATPVGRVWLAILHGKKAIHWNISGVRFLTPSFCSLEHLKGYIQHVDHDFAGLDAKAIWLDILT